jgi:hypothetical protein
MNEEEKPMTKVTEAGKERFAVIAYDPQVNAPPQCREVWMDLETGEVFIGVQEEHLYPQAMADGAAIVTDNHGATKLPVSWLIQNTESDRWEEAISHWEAGFRKLYPQHAGRMKDYRAMLRDHPDQADG